MSATLYPYEVTESLLLVLSEFDDPVTGRAVEVRELLRAQSVDSNPLVGGAYDCSTDTMWRKLTFKLVVEVPVADLERILPSSSDVSSDTELVVLMTCGATRFRRGVRLRYEGRGRWTGFTTLQRDDVRGSVALRPQLVRRTGIPASDLKGVATRPGSLVGIGLPATLYVDALPARLETAGSSVSIQWEDFANSEDPWRRFHGDDLFHLQPLAGEPMLWLNSRYGQLRAILDSQAKRGQEAALRDLMGVLIAVPVMMQMCLAALGNLETGEDPDSVSMPSGWHGDLLSTILPRLYPEVPEEEHRVVRAAREMRESDGVASLTSRLGSVVQGLVGSFRVMETAARAFESVLESTESNDA